MDMLSLRWGQTSLSAVAIEDQIGALNGYAQRSDFHMSGSE